MTVDFWNNKKCRYGILGGVVLLLTIISLAIRLLPMSALAGTGDMIAGPDAWYNLRLTEVLLSTGGYIGFEPLTLFPTGQEIVWGPLFTYISAFFAIIAGAATRVDIVTAASWTPAVLGALMVPVMFLLGRRLGDWKTGVLAAVFIAVAGGQFLSRSLYGHFDHHVAETLFSTLFCMCYCLALAHVSGKEISFKNKASLKLPIIFGVISGVAYFLGLLTMTTLLLFGLFAVLFTVIQFVLDVKSKRPTEYLLIINILTFGIGAIGLLIYGIQSLDFGYANYSLGLFLAQILAILATVFLYALQKVLAKFEKPWYIFPAAIAAVAVIGAVACWIILPDLFNSIIGNLLNSFVNSSGGAATVQELSAWSVDAAVKSYGWGILLAIGGVIVLLWQTIRHETPAALFVLIWSVLMFFITAAHIRWEYLFAANISILAAVCVSWAFSFAKDDIAKLFSKISASSKTGANANANDSAKSEPVAQNKKPSRKELDAAKRKAGKSAPAQSKKPDGVKLGVVAVALIVAIIFVGMSAATAIETASVYGHAGGTEKDWVSECTWLVNGTPDTGIIYDKLYDKEGFSYPDSAYGILSWWDYGHYITTIGKRIPNSNPFQSGVTGEFGAAQILTETNEESMTYRLDEIGTKYIMTDYQMAGGKFGAMAIWADPVLQTSPFYSYLLQKTQSGTYSVVSAQTEKYYNTLTARLQNFDGSYTKAGSVVLAITENAGYNYPVITSTKAYDNAADAWNAANKYNANAASGKHAYVISIPQTNTDYFKPNADVAALKHFRIVHESPTYIIPANDYSYYSTGPNGGGVSWVKTFEYVKGAVIKGNGVIAIDVTTNNGRNFTYRQVSENGQFVVPYATGQTGDIKTGVYRIEETGQTFTVSESAVQNGLSIN